MARAAGRAVGLRRGRRRGGYGLPAAQALQADPGDTLREGPFSVRVIESRHAHVLFGRVPLEGTLDAVPEAPLHALSFPLGDARFYLVRHEPSGVQVLLASSASAHPPALAAPISSPDAATPGDPEALAAFEQALRDAAEARGIATEVRRLGLFEAIALTRDGG